MLDLTPGRSGFRSCFTVQPESLADLAEPEYSCVLSSDLNPPRNRDRKGLMDKLDTVRIATSTGQVHTCLLNYASVQTTECTESPDAFRKQELILPKGLKQEKLSTSRALLSWALKN